MSLKEKNYLQCSARHTHSRSSVFKFALSYSSNSALKTRPTTKDLNNLAGWAPPPACVSYCGPCLAGKWTVKGIDRRWVCLHRRNMKYRVQIYCYPISLISLFFRLKEQQWQVPKARFAFIAQLNLFSARLDWSVQLFIPLILTYRDWFNITSFLNQFRPYLGVCFAGNSAWI